MREEEIIEVVADHAERKSIAGFTLAIVIFAKYFPNGVNEKFVFHAEHDIIYINVDNEKIDVNSDEGKYLRSLGWHQSSDSGTWAYYT